MFSASTRVSAGRPTEAVVGIKLAELDTDATITIYHHASFRIYQEK